MYMYINMCADCMPACMHIYVCVCVRACVYVCVYVYVCVIVCVYVYVYMCVCMYYFIENGNHLIINACVLIKDVTDTYSTSSHY